MTSDAKINVALDHVENTATFTSFSATKGDPSRLTPFMQFWAGMNAALEMMEDLRSHEVMFGEAHEAWKRHTAKGYR
jgi:hypothetical protein